MAHPQSNFTSTFNGTPLGNAKLTLSVNGVDHEYTPSGNDQTVDVNGNEVVHIDDPDFVQLLNVADADKCELIIKQDITADGAYRKYRLADCHVLNGDREWRFTCIAGNIEYILTVAEDGSVTPSQRLIPSASDDLPLEDGTASAGTNNQYSRKDHVHPHDSTKEDESNKRQNIDPTSDEPDYYASNNAVTKFVEKRTFAISLAYNTTSNNTFTKILSYDEAWDDDNERGTLFARVKLSFVSDNSEHRASSVEALIAFDLNPQHALVTFGSCYDGVITTALKKFHVVTYNTGTTRRKVEVYLEHSQLTAMMEWISVEVCENFRIETTIGHGNPTSHSAWKLPLPAYAWDHLFGANITPTAASLPTTGVLKTDSFLIQSGAQVPFTYVPSDDTFSDMAIAKLAKNSGDTRLVFKLYSSEGWVAIGKAERVNNAFKLNFSAISDSADFEAGVAVPYIYLSNLDGVYFVNLKIDSYHVVAKSIAIEIENENKDWEFFGSTIPDSVGDIAIYTETYMKANPTAEVIDQGTNVPAPTSSTKVLTKRVDASGREFWMTEQMSDIPVDAQGLKVVEIGSEAIDLDLLVGGDTVKCYFWSYDNVSNISHVPFNDAGWLVVYPQNGTNYARQIAYRRGTDELYTRHYDGAALTSWESFALGNGTYLNMIAGTARDYDTATGTIKTALSEKAIKFTLPDTGAVPRYTKLGKITGDTSGQSRSLTFICSCADNIGGSICDTYLVEYNNRLNTRSVKQTLLSPKQNRSSRQCEFGYILNSDGSIDVVVHLPDYSIAGDIVFLKRDNSFTWSYSAQVDGSNFVKGTRYIVANCIATGTGGVLLNVTSDYTLPALDTEENAWVRVRNAGSSSITVIAGTLNRTLSPNQSCDVYGYNGAYVQIS